jgi:hypothetical protein
MLVAMKVSGGMKNAFEMGLGSRVAGLGEFSPIGRLFTWGISLKITEVAQTFGLHFSTVKVVY